MTTNSESTFFQTYFDYVGETESPLVYHRWAITTAVAAVLRRECYFSFGHQKLYPNLFSLLVGSSGARKSTAINVARKLVHQAGYRRFAPDKCSKEQFLASMVEEDVPLGPDGQALDIEDLLDLTVEKRSDMFVCASEFPDFIGQGNTEFTTMLTNLWDAGETPYRHPKLNSQDVVVENYITSILGGTTPEGFSMAFPPEVIGQGFTSRIIFVYSDPSETKIPWPKKPNEQLGQELAEYISAIMQEVKGEITITDDAREALEQCYELFPPMEDKRLAHYSTRRFTLLLKVSMVLAALDLRKQIELKDALQANTMLHFAECRMHKALGEYGRSKNSSQQASVLDLLEHSSKPLTIAEIWKKVSTDVTRQSELIDIIKNLALAEKVQVVTTDTGSAFRRLHKVRQSWSDKLILPDFLELEEMA